MRTADSRIKMILKIYFYIVIIFAWVSLALFFSKLFRETRRYKVDHVQMYTAILDVPLGDELDLKSNIPASLNHHIWPLGCRFKLRNLREYPFFPSAPWVQKLVGSLNVSGSLNKDFSSQYVGHRVFGYLRPLVSGNYMFSVSVSGKEDAEFSLSKNKDPQNLQVLCEIDNEKVPNKNYDNSSAYSNKFSHHCVSQEVYLEEKHSYFFELLLQFRMSKTTTGFGIVTWRTPGSQEFTTINKTYFFSYTDQATISRKIAETKPMFDNSWEHDSILENTKFFRKQPKYLDFKEIRSVLSSCPYKPGYVGKPLSYRYETVVKYVNPTFVYPETRHDQLHDGKWIPWFPLDEKIAVDITEKYMKYMSLVFPGRYELSKILNVERKTNWLGVIPKFYNGTSKDGDRYLLELQLWDNEKKEYFILSQFIYEYYNKNILCYPDELQWNISTPVYLLISVRKQETWVKHLIKNLEKIYDETQDDNLHLVLYDYNTTEINIGEELRRSRFKNYQVLRNTDSKYSRTFSLNRAAETVTNPHAIVFTLDLHLEIPSTFPNNLRKHCIEGRMVYTPIIARLSCGSMPGDPAGHWDPWGYGMFGAFKSDWDRFGGFNEERFSTKWGGEDWDLMDRAYKVGLEFERIKHADFYHYYHTRKGMW